MADFGVMLRNNQNLVVANANDVNYTLRSSGQITNAQFPAGSSADPFSYIGIQMAGFTCPLVFIRSTNSNQRVALVCNEGFDFMGSGETLGMGISIAKWWNLDVGTLQYYIFDRWFPPERSPYGFRIRDAANNVIFDSGWHFLKLRNVIWLDPGYPNHANDDTGANWTQVGSAGAGTLAISMPNPRAYIRPGMTVGWYLYECFHMDEANNIFTSLVPWGMYFWGMPTEGWAHKDARSQVMVADVANLPTNYNSLPI